MSRKRLREDVNGLEITEIRPQIVDLSTLASMVSFYILI